MSKKGPALNRLLWYLARWRINHEDMFLFSSFLNHHAIEGYTVFLIQIISLSLSFYRPQTTKSSYSRGVYRWQERAVHYRQVNKREYCLADLNCFLKASAKYRLIPLLGVLQGLVNGNMISSISFLDYQPKGVGLLHEPPYFWTTYVLLLVCTDKRSVNLHVRGERRICFELRTLLQPER